MEVRPEGLMEISEEYRLSTEPVMQMRNLLEILLPVFADELKFLEDEPIN